MRKLQFSSSTISISFAGLVCAIAYSMLAAHSYSTVSFVSLIIHLTPAIIATFACWLYLYWKDIQPSLIHVIAWAVLFKIIGISGLPILEDDHFRYLWDGYMLVEYGSPYGVAPSEFFGAEHLSEELSDLLDGINHPDIATIYGPACQVLFALAYLLMPLEISLLQGLFALCDLGIILLLSRLATARNLLLYAWCPLLIKEFAFTAHTDTLALFFLVAACVALQHKHWKLMGILLATSLASKVFALIALPFLLLQSRKSWLPFAVTLSAFYLPFASDLFNPEHGLTAMASGWVFNAPLYHLIPLNEWFLKALLASLFIAFTGVLFYRWQFKKAQNNRLNQNLKDQDDKEFPPLGWLYGGFLLILPVVNPWYLVWALPFAVIRPYVSFWVASAAALLAYAIGLNLETETLISYQQPAWALILEYGVIILAGIWDIYFRSRTT